MGSIDSNDSEINQNQAQKRVRNKSPEWVLRAYS